MDFLSDKKMQSKCMIIGFIISACIGGYITHKNNEKQKKEDERCIKESTSSLILDLEKDLQNRLENKLQNYRSEED